MEDRRSKRDWTQDELIEHWTLAPSELVLLMNKSGPGRVGFALLLKFFQANGRFPSNRGEIPAAAVEYIIGQTRVASSNWDDYDWQGRTIKYHGAEIRALLGFREATVEDCESLMVWLRDHVLAQERHTQNEFRRRRFSGSANWSLPPGQLPVLSRPCTCPVQDDQLGGDRATIRPDSQVRDSVEVGNCGYRRYPAPLPALQRETPVHQALSELGKASKTIFLCRYLNSMELRREINKGLNVIENWNSANDFI